MLAREFKLHFLAYAILISVTKLQRHCNHRFSEKADDYKARASIISHTMKTGRIDALNLRERINEHVKLFPKTSPLRKRSRRGELVSL